MLTARLFASRESGRAARLAPVELGLLALLATLGCKPAPLTSGGFVRDDQGRARLYRAFNLTDRSKRPPFLPVHDVAGGTEPFSRDILDQLDSRGFNSVRFLMIWEALEPERGQFDKTYLDAVAGWVDELGRRGFDVLLDFHQDLWSRAFTGGDGAPRFACPEELYASFERTHDPTAPWFTLYSTPEVIACFDRFWDNVDGLQDEYAAAWVKVAERFRDSPHVLGFDLMNEPWHGSHNDLAAFEREKLGPFYQKVIDAVRKVDDRRRFFLEPAVQAAMTEQPLGMDKIDAPGIVFAPHYYEISHEAGLPYAGDKAVTRATNVFAAGAHRLGDVPVFIGEFGCKSDSPDCPRLVPDQMRVYDTHFFSSSVWEVDQSPAQYSITAPDGSMACNSQQSYCTADLMTRPFAQAVAGKPTSMSYDPASGTFTLEWETEADAKEPTEIRVPAGSYPAGFDVEAPGTKTKLDAKTGILSAESDRSSGAHRLVLRRK